MIKYSTDSRIRMIGFDLDGTLLTTEKEISSRTKQALAEAVRQGVVILPATGRPLSGIPAEVLALPGVRYAVASNGARITDLQEDRVVYEKLLPYEAGLRMLEICAQYDALLEIYYDGVGYADRERLQHLSDYVPRPPMAHYIGSTRVAVDDVMGMYLEKGRPTDKVQAIFSRQDEYHEAWARVEQELPDVEITGALSNNIEVNARGVNKGKGLLMLGELLGIRREEIMAFGDGSNDIAMLREAGMGVAMENASEDVKQAADLITLSNDQDGVARAIETYVLCES